MPREPTGQTHRGDVVGKAIRDARIAAGTEEFESEPALENTAACQP